MARRRGGHRGVPGGGGRRRGPRVPSPAGPGPGGRPGRPVRLGRRDAPPRSARRRPARGVRARRGGGDGGVPRAPAGGVAGRSVAPLRPRVVDRLPSRDRSATSADLPGRLFVHRARPDRVATPREPVRPDARRLPGVPLADARRTAVGRHPFRLRAAVHPSGRAGHPDDPTSGRARRRVPAHRDRGEPRHDVRDRRRVPRAPPGSSGVRGGRVRPEPRDPLPVRRERAQRSPGGARDRAGRLVRRPGADALGDRAPRVRGTGQGHGVPPAAPARDLGGLATDTRRTPTRRGDPRRPRFRRGRRRRGSLPPVARPHARDARAVVARGMARAVPVLPPCPRRDQRGRAGRRRARGVRGGSGRRGRVARPRRSRAPPRRGVRCSSSSGVGGGRCSS